MMTIAQNLLRGGNVKRKVKFISHPPKTLFYTFFFLSRIAFHPNWVTFQGVSNALLRLQYL